MSDDTFITNENGKTLSNRLNELTTITQQFDVIVGYFFISGFHKIYKSLEKVEKVKILVGLSTDKKVSDLVNSSRQSQLDFDSIKSKKQIKEDISQDIQKEVLEAEDSHSVEEGIRKFIDWLKNGKLEIRIYPNPLHAKVYIFSYDKDHSQPISGSIITGSSNLTRAGLDGNLEFNVELTNSRDYKFAKEKFEQLWADSIELTDQYIDTIEKKTHLSESITPYEIYLKFLYEYFKSDLISFDDEDEDLPEGFMDLDYQKQAVINAKKILEKHGGVFISDVVGLGKTFITTRLIKSLNQRTLVIAPPALLDENNPGSWFNVFEEFGVRHRKFQSLGNLDYILENGIHENIEIIVIDESHRFRNQGTEIYNKLAEICKGKKVILVSATPFNNTPSDLLAQIKLFQNSRKSTIPNLPDLDNFFSRLNGKIRGLDRKKDYEEYMSVVKNNAKEIREKVLKYLMVRRTRGEISKYFGTDLSKQNLKFPEVIAPQPVFYEFDNLEDKAFQETLEFIKIFKYSRYTPMLYFKGEITEQEKQGQKNMTTFMKMLLVKRFESSLFAFRKTIGRFIHSYEITIDQFKNGHIYISKKNANKLLDLLSDQDEIGLQNLLDDDKAQEYSAENFRPEILADLEFDLDILRKIFRLWENVKRDVKLDKFISLLKSDRILAENKLIVFTESQETADYLTEKINEVFPNAVLNYTGGSSLAKRFEVISNFDAKSRKQDDDYRILIATDVLAEGVNLHRSNCVINYDIPWNPTRMIQRVGRVNRVDTKFKEIYTYNFFPTTQANDELKLRESAEAKINMFIELLGNDARLFTEGEEIKSHDLFQKLNSKNTILGEDENQESELKYLQIIKSIKEKKPELFAQIKNLPKKARVSRISNFEETSLISYFQKGNIDKFIITKGDLTSEIDFLESAKIMESEIDEKAKKISEDFYLYLEKNKNLFDEITNPEIEELEIKRGGDSAQKLVKRLRIILKKENFSNSENLNEDQEDFLRKVIDRADEGALSRGKAKKLFDLISTKEIGTEPQKIYSIIRKNLSDNWLKKTAIEIDPNSQKSREVILSQMFQKEEN